MQKTTLKSSENAEFSRQAVFDLTNVIIEQIDSGLTFEEVIRAHKLSNAQQRQIFGRTHLDYDSEHQAQQGLKTAKGNKEKLTSFPAPEIQQPSGTPPKQEVETAVSKAQALENEDLEEMEEEELDIEDLIGSGTGKKTVQVPEDADIWVCSDCGCEFTDEEPVEGMIQCPNCEMVYLVH